MIGDRAGLRQELLHLIQKAQRIELTFNLELAFYIVLAKAFDIVTK